MGTAKGLYQQLPNGSFKQIQFLAAQGNDVPVICFCDSKGFVWISTIRKPGLYCYNVTTGKTIDYSYALSDTHVNSYFTWVNHFCEDNLGDIWIGTFGNGITRFNRKFKTFTRFPFIYNNTTITDTHGALDDNGVRSIYEDKQGIIWVGTNLGSLNRFNRDKETFTSYIGRSPGFSSVDNINEDSKGRLWATTYFGGLFMLDKNRDSIKRLTEEEGLLYDGAASTQEDNNRKYLGRYTTWYFHY